MRIECCIPKVTDAHSEYVTIIVFLLQQWLHESASILRYTYSYTAYLSFLSITNDNDTRNINNYSAHAPLKKRRFTVHDFAVPQQPRYNLM
jgi:hypothetical protein